MASDTMIEESNPRATPSAREMARAGGLHTVGLIILLGGAFLPIADFFIVNVALPTIDRSLHASPASLELIVAGYGAAYASVLVLGGRLGDRFGRRHLFQWGAAAFVLASAACGFSPDIWFLVGARVIQGASAAMLVPQVLATFHTTLEGQRRTRALAMYGATSGLAGVVGQVAGGLLVTANIAGTSWRPIFLINVPIGAVVLLISRHVVPSTRSPHPAPVDLPGTILFGATLVSLIVPLTEGQTLGWPLWIWLMFVLAAVLATTTVVIERRSERMGKTPLLPPSLLKLPSMSRGLAMLLLMTSGFGSFMFVFALTVQDGLHHDALVGGVSVLPMAAFFFLGSLLSPKVINRFGRAAIGAGAVIGGTGLASLVAVATLTWPHVSLFALALPLMVFGVGQSMLFTGLFRVVLTDVPVPLAGIGGGVLITLQQTGLALGVALLGTLYLTIAPHSYPDAFAAAIGVQVLFMACMAVGSRFLPRFTDSMAHDIVVEL